MKAQVLSWRDPALWITALPVLLVMGGVFLVPLGMTVALSFQTMASYRLVWTWDVGTWAAVLTQPHHMTILARTLGMALACTALCVGLGLVVAVALAGRASAWAGHVKVLIVFAFLADAVLKAHGWVLILDRAGLAHEIARLLGLGGLPGGLLYTPGATLLGMVHTLLPYTIFTIYLALVRIDRDLVRAARDAGASHARAFWAVTLPLARPGLIVGGALVFVLALGAFLEPKILGGGTAPMAAEAIRQSFETRVDWPTGAALTLLTLALGLLVLIPALAWAGRRHQGSRRR